MSTTSVLVRHGVPVLAVVLLGFAAWSMSANYSPRSITEPVTVAPENPYDAGVAATGLVEPASELVAVAIEHGGVVTHVDVVAGDRVVAGQSLFGIDDRKLRAAVAQQASGVAAAQAQLDLAGQTILLQQSTIARAVAGLAMAEAENRRAGLDRRRYTTLAHDDWASPQRREAADADAGKASANVAAATADLAAARQQNAVLAAQRDEARARLALADAALDQARVDVDRAVVRAPIGGSILKVNIHPGEYAQAGVLETPLLTMGAVETLHVRADIDEADSWRVCPDGAAVARLRGNSAVTAPLSFVRFEPYVMPKRSLSDGSAERVDTRVLQVIYAFAPVAFPAFVGQQVDVFIEAKARAGCGGAPRPQAVRTAISRSGS